MLGYHGCDEQVGLRLLEEMSFKPSVNDYDWLGHGTYFWEANPVRGLEWAEELRARKREIKVPYVDGGVIDLGNCLDLASSSGISLLKKAHHEYVSFSRRNKFPIPRNRGGSDLFLRHLDCAVINYLCESALEEGQRIDTVRGVFIEGERIYPTAGFREKTHIQICVRNAESIKAVFRVPRKQLPPFDRY